MDTAELADEQGEMVLVGEVERSLPVLQDRSTVPPFALELIRIMIGALILDPEPLLTMEKERMVVVETVPRVGVARRLKAFKPFGIGIA